jgi:hypothetical protein
VGRPVADGERGGIPEPPRHRRDARVDAAIGIREIFDVVTNGVGECLAPIDQRGRELGP